jgi:hypothetical protein
VTIVDAFGPIRPCASEKVHVETLQISKNPTNSNSQVIFAIFLLNLLQTSAFSSLEALPGPPLLAPVIAVAPRCPLRKER